MSCDPDEFRYGLMLAYLELETALGAIQADYEFLDKDRSPEDAVDALLRARCSKVHSRRYSNFPRKDRRPPTLQFPGPAGRSAMSDAALRTALAVFAEDLGRARDTLLADVDDIASEPIGDIDKLESQIDEILWDGDEGLEAGPLIVVERATIAALRISSGDPSGDIEDAFRDYDWLVRRAFAEFREALDGTAERASRTEQVGARQ